MKCKVILKKVSHILQKVIFWLGENFISINLDRYCGSHEVAMINL